MGAYGLHLRDGMVRRLLDRFGQDATLKRFTGTTGDRAGGGVTPVYSDITVRVFVGAFDETERATGGITAQDRKVYIDGKSLAGAGVADLATEDRLVIGSDKLGLQAIERKIVDGELVYYHVLARKAA